MILYRHPGRQGWHDPPRENEGNLVVAMPGRRSFDSLTIHSNRNGGDGHQSIGLREHRATRGSDWVGRLSDCVVDSNAIQANQGVDDAGIIAEEAMLLIVVVAECRALEGSWG